MNRDGQLACQNTLACTVNGTVYINAYEAVNHIVTLPEANQYKAALGLQQYIQAMQSTADDLLIRLYGIVKKKKKKKFVNR